jgi:GTP-binding protein
MPASPNAKFITSYGDPDNMPKTGLPQVAMLGRSNAGKSSLINALTGVKNLAIVSASPGRTRLINAFDVGGAYHLIDLPGYGYAKGSHGERDKLAGLIEGYIGTAPLLRLVIIIVDSRLGPTDSDKEMIEYIEFRGLPYVIVANKVDKLSRTELSNSLRSITDAYPHTQVIAHSSVTGAGKGELIAAIDKIVRKEKTAL